MRADRAYKLILVGADGSTHTMHDLSAESAARWGAIMLGWQWVGYRVAPAV